MSPRPTLSHHWTKEKKKEDFEKKKKKKKNQTHLHPPGFEPAYSWVKTLGHIPLGYPSNFQTYVTL